MTHNLDQSLILLTLSWIILDFATLSVVYLGFNALSKSKIYHKILLGCGVILIAVALYGIYSVWFLRTFTSNNRECCASI